MATGRWDFQNGMKLILLLKAAPSYIDGSAVPCPYSMKNRLLHLVIALLALSAGGCMSQSLSLPGTYIATDVKGKEVPPAAAFAVAAEARALQPNDAHPALTLVKIVAAEQQVVAGMNFKLTLTVTQDGKEKTAVATVWWQSWRKPDPYRLTGWEWK
ncbi:MAG: proteinase inhibitor cystatin [Verrucomicrobiaceae bacterium]|nr:proteinase inhibitor cystatin [Verrucomicrobiaceae bacterium]